MRAMVESIEEDMAKYIMKAEIRNNLRASRSCKRASGKSERRRRKSEEEAGCQKGCRSDAMTYAHVAVEKNIKIAMVNLE